MQGTTYSIQQVVRGGKQTMTSGGPFWGRTPEEKADLAGETDCIVSAITWGEGGWSRAFLLLSLEDRNGSK